MRSRHVHPFGAHLLDGGGALLRLWAPSAARVELEIQDSRHAMRRQEGGWHEATVAEAAAGQRYRYHIDGRPPVPDPASRCNPGDVHAASELVDPLAYEWHDTAWHGRPWHEAVVYELHVGTFTPEGSFRAAAGRLAGLVELGITAIELMPVADFPGACNWGYDGVLPFAPDASYGRPEDLKALVDQAHALGLMVLLDVVYNHFGPEGNHLHAYCPEFFNPAHATPWGAAIHFDGPHSGPVRDFFIHNALYWVEEFHFDGLRLDAVHAMHDSSAEHITCAIGRALRDGPGRQRHVHLVLENEHNQARLLERDALGGVRCATAQWNDDLHHAAHVLLTGETEAWYQDYAQAPAQWLARALAQGFAYQGQHSPSRAGQPRGERCLHLPPAAFVSFLQNHDHVGNRAFGERLHHLADAGRLEAAYACLLLSPHVPLLFHGEEFAASTPFLYFCDFGPELAAAVSRGRREEFARFAAFRAEAQRRRIPDPAERSSFIASKLRWEERHEPPHRERLALVQYLLALRHQHLVPRLVPGLAGLQQAGSHRHEAGLIRVEWLLGDGSPWHLLAHFGTQPVGTGAAPDGEVIYSRGVVAPDAGTLQLQPGGVRVVRGFHHGQT